MDQFDFTIPSSLKKSLHDAQYIKPTPIQEKAIPLILEGKDIVGLAQTGTGKTGAFLIPILAKMIDDPSYQALILTPTRELGQQIIQLSRTLTPRSSRIHQILLIGGQSYNLQYKLLSQKPRLIIGTPGRILDHVQQGSLNLQAIRTVVLDETDRLLDMGFEDQLKNILSHVSEDRQTLLFSATLPKSIRSLVRQYLKNPEEVSIGAPNRVANRVTQEITITENKDLELLNALKQREGSILVFVNSQRGVEKLTSQLRHHNHQAEALHGGMRQSRRQHVLQAFRNKKVRILVATDVAARGLDIPHISHVINYELPFSPEDYIHRIGRTARADASGESLSLIAPDENHKWKNIERFLKGQDSEDRNQRQTPWSNRSQRDARNNWGGRSSRPRFASSRSSSESSPRPWRPNRGQSGSRSYSSY